MILYLFTLLSILLSPAATPTDCEPIHTLVGGEPLSWVGYENGAWDGWPTDIKATDYINFADGHGGVLEYRAESTPGVRWLIVFVSYEYSTDTNGDHGGNHRLCGPFRIEDEW